MVCTVCSGTRFVSAEYNTGEAHRSRPAPALECVTCHAVFLEEGIARTEEERASVKIAIALRAAAQEPPAPRDERDRLARPDAGSTEREKK